MADREKVEEWARDFKAYVDELDIARDDYRGIMEYIDDALALLREQETVEPVVHCKDANLSNGADFACSGCGGSFLHKVVNFCPW